MRLFQLIRDKFKIILGILAFAVFEYFLINEFATWVVILTGAIFVACLGMTLPIYFNLGGELVYPIGEAHATILFTAGMNIFGLVIIESIKIIDSEIGSEGSDFGLIWTGVFQGGLLFLGLIFFAGRVESFVDN